MGGAVAFKMLKNRVVPGDELFCSRYYVMLYGRVGVFIDRQSGSRMPAENMAYPGFEILRYQSAQPAGEIYHFTVFTCFDIDLIHNKKSGLSSFSILLSQRLHGVNKKNINLKHFYFNRIHEIFLFFRTAYFM